MKKFHLITLGCKVNQYESQALRENWLEAGCAESSDPGRADLICINSCAITGKAVADLRAAISRSHRAAPRAEIIVTGCAAQVFAEELAVLPGVSRVIAQDQKESLLHAAGQTPAREAWPGFGIRDYARARAVLKVQDGCSHRCAYCIVPLTRGRNRSRPLSASLAEAKRLLEAGFREITLSGVNLAQYGRDMPEAPDFWDLLSALEKELAPEWAGRARLRISSLEPGQLGPKALETLARSEMIAPHLHLSLQSGSPEVLRRMGRGHYELESLLAFCADLRQIWPLFGLGADLLSGFPGETEAEALQTEEFCVALPLSYAHVFPYSRRPGTLAASMENQIPQPLKKARTARLRELAAGKKAAFLEENLRLPALSLVLESASRGMSEFYVDCRLAEKRGRGAVRSLIRVRPLEIREGILLVGAPD